MNQHIAIKYNMAAVVVIPKNAMIAFFTQVPKELINVKQQKN